MKTLIKKIVPGSLYRLDDHLLENYPLLWASRLHFLIYFELLLFCFNTLISSFQPISYTHIPGTTWLLIYGMGTNLILLIVWIYHQTLLDVIYFHGNKTRFFNVKTASLFFVVFFFVAVSVILPYLNLNRRIVGAFKDDSLPTPGRVFNPSAAADSAVALADTTVMKMDTAAKKVDTAAMSVDSFNTLKSINYGYLADVKRRYDSMDSRQKFNILVSLGTTDFGSLRDFRLVDTASRPYVRFTKSDYLNNADLTIFYNEILKSDSNATNKFNITVYHRTIKALQRVESKDSLINIDKYYFLSQKDNHFIICDQDNLQTAIVQEKIAQSMGGPQENVYTEALISQLSNHYDQALATEKDSILTLFICIFINILLATLVLIIYAFIRFLGVRAFFIGLITPFLIAGIFIALVNYGGGLIRFNISVLWPALIVSILFLLLFRKNKPWNLLLFQIGSYYFAVSLWILPIHLLEDVFNQRLKNMGIGNDLLMYLEVSLSFISLFLFSSVFISKMYRIYCRPQG